MIAHLESFWWAYWSIGVSVALLFFSLRDTNGKSSRADRVRSLLIGHAHRDDPGLFGRQVRILLIGMPLVALMLFVVWLLER